MTTTAEIRGCFSSCQHPHSLSSLLAFNSASPIMSNIGVPTKLLQESLGHVVTVELKSGQVYRGKLFEGGFRMSMMCIKRCAGRGLSIQKVQAEADSHLLICACVLRTTRSRGQPERLDEGHHRHAAGRPGDPARPGLHPGPHDPLLHCPRYARKCANVRDLDLALLLLLAVE